MAKILTIVVFAALLSVSCARQQFGSSQIQYDESGYNDDNQNLTGKAFDGADGEGGDADNEADGNKNGGGSGTSGDGDGKGGGGDQDDGPGGNGDKDDGPGGNDSGDIDLDAGENEIRNPKSDVGPFTTFCSENGGESAGTNVQDSRGVAVALYSNSGSREAFIDDEDDTEDIRDELVNSRRFTTRGFGKVDDGTYYIVLCDDSMTGGCSPGSDFVNDFRDDFESLEDAPRGLVGMATNVRVRDGEVTSTGTAAMLLHNRRNGDSGCEVTNSPLVVDFGGSGIKMSAPTKGVSFDITGDGNKETVSWPTTADSAFVALDVNHNGTIDSIHELFGNHTIGPDGAAASNGFAALAKYDDNADGKIDSADAIYSALLLWRDSNQNGATDAGETTFLSDSLSSVSVDYIEAYERDQYGNETRQRSAARLQGSDATRMVFDLWFRTLY